MSEVVNITKEKWDYLIVLDACRYDFFEKVYKDYLRGKLRKMISLGNTTSEWFINNFENKKLDDVIYVSANPTINSKGIIGIDATKHFYRVIDVWDWGWNQKLGTVHPETVNKTVLALLDLMNAGVHPKKRTIIHYAQPHAPLLCFTQKGISRTVEKEQVILGNKMISDFLGHLIESLNNLFVRSYHWRRLFTAIRWRFGAIPDDQETLAYKYGTERLHQAYEENLRVVLYYVAKLVKHLSGKIVITADHGNMLGEEGIYDHPVWSRHRLQLEVPWFEVTKPIQCRRGR